MAQVPVNGLRNQYNQGVDSSTGVNNTLFYYEKAGIKASNAKAVFSQFVNKNFTIPSGHGTELRISRFFNGYDRYLDDPDFAKKGWLTGRDIRSVTANIEEAILPESAGPQNYKTNRKITITASIQEFGAMLEYSDRLDYFSEDAWYSRLYQTLGYWAGQTHEDQLMLSLLESPTTAYSGDALAINEVGSGVSLTGDDIATPSLNNGTNTLSDDFSKPSFDLFRKIAFLLKKYRADPINSIVVGSEKTDTRVVGSSYFGIVSPAIHFDLETITNPYDVSSGSPALAWLTPEMYGDAAKLAVNEIGALARNQFRFVLAERLIEYAGQGANTPINLSVTETQTGFGFAAGHGISIGWSGGLEPATGSVQKWIGIQGSNTYYSGKLKHYNWSITPTAGGAAYTPADVAAIYSAIKQGRGSVAIAHVTVLNNQTTVTINEYSDTTLPASIAGASDDNYYVILTDYFTVHPIIVPTKDAFALVGLKGKNKLLWHNKTPSAAVSLANPYGTVGFISVRFWYGSLIYKPENLLVAFVAASDY
jgi:N4-gp56 family major capsid protein